MDRAREAAPDVPLDFETRGETTVPGDEALLTHLLENLIGNGVRHGRGAPMRVRVAEQGGLVCLAVEDAGPGVPEAVLTRLTEPFYQVEAARGGGNGLGLAIVRRVAEAHGALLHFENQPAGGLLVTIEFPRAPTA